MRRLKDRSTSNLLAFFSHQKQFIPPSEARRLRLEATREIFMKRLICIFLALTLLLGMSSLIVGCNNEGGEEEESTVVEAPKIPLIEKGKSSYIIIYPDEATPSEIEAVYIIREAIASVTGLRLKSMTEEYKDSEKGANIIYVGNTSFAPAKTAKEEISKEYHDAYAIEYSEKDIYIVAASEEALITAANFFAEDIVKGNYDSKTKTLLFASHRYNGEVVLEDGFAVKNIRDYSIVYTSEDGVSFKSTAMELQEIIEERTGFKPDIFVDTELEEGSFEILIGETNRSLSQKAYDKTSRIMEYEIVIEQYKVQLAIGGYFSAEKCLTAFSEKILRKADQTFASGNYYKTVLTDKTQTLTEGADVRIMSANILAYRWGESKAPNVRPVAQRCEIFMGILRNSTPDAIGVQETDQPWVDVLPWYLSRMAEKDGIEYTFLFSEATHESMTMINFSTILYRSDLYNLDDSGVEVFSIWDNTPSYFQRVASYVKLTSKTDADKEFILVNTHWAHEDDATVNACAVEQANLVNRLKDKYKDVTIFNTGDYNNLPSRKWKDTYLNQFVAAINGKIASKVAKDKGVLLVPGGCRGGAEDMIEGILRDIDDDFIDHIIYAGGTCDVLCHDTIRENKSQILTDHSPIYADFKLN